MTFARPASWTSRRKSLAVVRRRRNTRSALVLVGCCVLLSVLATTAGADQAKRTPPATSGTIVWAGRVFTTPHQLEAWLKSRGVDYRRWVARHPRAAAGQRRPEPVAPSRQDSVKKIVVITRAVVITLLALVGYLMLPFRLSIRRLARRPRFSA